MRITSQFNKSWGREMPPQEFINRQLCKGIADELYKMIEKGTLKVIDRDGMAGAVQILEIELK